MSEHRDEPPPHAKTHVEGSPTATRRAALGVGETIDDFLLLQELGEGAFAKVFLAHQQSLHRTVALKVYEGASSEAETLAQLDHPNIVRVHDQRHVAGQDLRLLYMEYVPGGTLEPLIHRVGATAPQDRSGRLVLDVLDETLRRRGEQAPLDSMLRARLAGATWPEAVCLLGAHMAVALDYAHSRGILHRDVKPANVLLDASGRPKLADFNISYASTLDGASAEQNLGGSLPYMSPEQLRACSPFHDEGAEDMDARSDLYGLGVVLFELLVGRLPFPDPPEGLGWEDLFAFLLETREAGIDAAARASVPGDVPPMVLATLEMCLARQRDERPATGADLRRRLEICLDPHLRELLTPATAGPLRWLRRFPLCGLVLLGLVVNGLLSVLNITYNINVVVPEHDRAPFLLRATLVNAVAFPLGIVLFLLVGWPLRQALRRREQARPTTPEDRRRARARGLGLGDLMAAVVLPLWILGGFAFPLWEHMHAGASGEATWFHFVVSNALFGLLAATVCFFLLGAALGRVLLPRLVQPGDVDDEGVRQIDRLLRRRAWYFAACTFVPLVSIILLGLRAEGLAAMAAALVALGLMGVLAFLLTLGLGHRMRADFTALRAALVPPRDRFRPP